MGLLGFSFKRTPKCGLGNKKLKKKRMLGLFAFVFLVVNLGYCWLAKGGIKPMLWVFGFCGGVILPKFLVLHLLGKPIC